MLAEVTPFQNQIFFLQRCTEEREARFNNLTDTIKRSQTVAVPLKQTKLAYVNSAVKPPRGIIKKQVNFYHLFYAYLIDSN